MTKGFKQEKEKCTGYFVKCFNESCGNTVYVKKSIYEKNVYKMFCCSNSCKNSKYVYLKRIEIFEKIHGVKNNGQKPFKI